MNRDMLALAVTKGLMRKYNEAVAGFYSGEEFLEDLLYGVYALERIINDLTLANHFKYMARDFIYKHAVGFVRAYLLNDDIEFDPYDIKEKIWFLILYDDIDLGKIGNIKKSMILSDVKNWFNDIYMEVKWDESDDFIELLMLMSHVKSLRKLPINDLRDALMTVLLHKYDGRKPHWGLYWLTGNVKYITDEDIFNRKAWIFWKE